MTTAYIDGIDWQHHIDDDAAGVMVFGSIENLKAGTSHDLAECGIVKIELCEVEWVVPQNLKFTK